MRCRRVTALMVIATQLLVALGDRALHQLSCSHHVGCSHLEDSRHDERVKTRSHHHCDHCKHGGDDSVAEQPASDSIDWSHGSVCPAHDAGECAICRLLSQSLEIATVARETLVSDSPEWRPLPSPVVRDVHPKRTVLPRAPPALFVV